jgi:hypothetical protein
MNHKLGVSGVIVALALTGCAKGVNFGSNALSSGNGSEGVPSQAVAVPACEINIPQLLLNANVNSFEFQDSGGISFGYNSNGTLPGLGGSISDQISTASMSLTMDGQNPLGLNALVYASTVSAAQTSTNLNASINFSGFGLGGNTFSSTPLATVSLNGLDLGVQGIKTQEDTQPFIGRVIQFANASTVIINAGLVNGIVQGDTYNVYNVQHFWQDNTQPCAPGNAYLGSEQTPTTPVAVITISTVDSNTSFGTVVLTSQTQVNLGAEVHALTLVAPAKGAPARYLKKNVIIGTIPAKLFAVPGGANFDFGSAVNGQFLNAVTANGFVVIN